MIATTMDYQKLQHWRSKRLYCHFRLSVIVAIARGQFLLPGHGWKPQICRWNCRPICHHSRDINISGLGNGHTAISGCRSLSQSLGDTLFALAVVMGGTRFPPLIFLRKKLFIKIWSCDLDLRTSDFEWSWQMPFLVDNNSTKYSIGYNHDPSDVVDLLTAWTRANQVAHSL